MRPSSREPTGKRSQSKSLPTQPDSGRSDATVDGYEGELEAGGRARKPRRNRGSGGAWLSGRDVRPGIVVCRLVDSVCVDGYGRWDCLTAGRRQRMRRLVPAAGIVAVVFDLAHPALIATVPAI